VQRNYASYPLDISDIKPIMKEKQRYEREIQFEEKRVEREAEEKRFSKLQEQVKATA